MRRGFWTSTQSSRRLETGRFWRVARRDKYWGAERCNIDELWSITTSSSGQVIQNLNITGSIHVKHDNVIIRNVRINGPFGRWAAISSDNNAKGAVIEDCEVNGNRTLGSYGIGIGGTVRRCKVWGVENGLTPQSNALYEDNYVYSLNPSGNDPHTDAVPIQGGPSNVTLRHNTFDTSGSTGFNATVFLNGYFGPMDNILFDNNRFIGIRQRVMGRTRL